MTTAPAKDRTQSIGGSDLGAVFNLPPYGCRRRLWYEKVGVTRDYPQIETAPMRRGKFFEPIVRKFYEEQTGLVVEPGPIELVHAERPFSTGQLDGRVRENGTSRPWECKVPGEFIFRQIKRKGMSDEYILQLQKYIHLDGADAGTFAVFHADSVDMLTFDVALDPMICNEIRWAEDSFWKQVTDGSIPERLESVDRRCSACNWRTTCQGAAMLESVKDSDGDIPFDSSLDPLMEEYAQAKEIHDEATALLDGVKARIKEAMGDLPAVQTSGNRIYFRPQTSRRWDTRTMAKALGISVALIQPEARGIEAAIEQSFKTPSVSRPLRVFFT